MRWEQVSRQRELNEPLKVADGTGNKPGWSVTAQTLAVSQWKEGHVFSKLTGLSPLCCRPVAFNFAILIQNESKSPPS